MKPWSQVRKNTTATKRRIALRRRKGVRSSNEPGIVIARAPVVEHGF
jgi:hypothetical protein